MTRLMREENPVVAEIMRPLSDSTERSAGMEYPRELEARYAAHQERMAELAREVQRQPARTAVSPIRERLAARLVALARWVEPAVVEAAATAPVTRS